MLPKLQQSSLAQNLRRDNPVTLAQSTFALTQLRTNWRTLCSKPIMSHISHGKISMPQKTLTLLLVISRKTICPNRKPNKKSITPTMSWRCRDLCKSMTDPKETEATAPQPSKERKPLKTHLQKVELSKKERCRSQTLEGTTIEEIYQLELIIKVRSPNWSGRFQLNLLTTITTYPSFSTAAERKSTLTAHSQSWAHTIYWTKEAAKFFQSFPS